MNHDAVAHVFDPLTDDPQTLIDELTYASYRYNRDRSPAITPERWARIFPTGPALERRYQEEQFAREAARTRDTMHEDAQRRDA